MAECEELREEMADLIRDEVTRQRLDHPASQYLDFRKIADAVVDGLDQLVADECD